LDLYNDNLEANGEGPFPECSRKFQEIMESWRKFEKVGKEEGTRKEEGRKTAEGSRQEEERRISY